MDARTAAGAGAPKRRKGYVMRRIRDNKYLYMLIALPVLYFIVFKYGAMLWLSIGFMDFNAFLGVFKSPWVGFKHFSKFITDPYFWNIVKNTVLINVYMIIFYFPVPIILALLINEVRGRVFKKFAQSVSYLPYFLSNVVVCGFVVNILSTSGAVNQILGAFGIGPITFMAEPGWVRPIYVLTEMWQQSGWGSIIYLAALAGVDSQLYEAAAIDGASKWKQLWKISLPCISPVISIQLLLTVGRLLSVGYEKLILFYPIGSGATYATSDVISTYVYRRGLYGADYSYGAAVSIFQAVISLVLVWLANRGARKIGSTSLW